MMNIVTHTSTRNFHTIIKCILVATLLFTMGKLYAAPGSVVTTTEEFVSTPYAAGFVPQEPYTAAWHYQDSSYLVWVDAKFRPWVTQVTNGKSTTVPLDNNPDYTTQPDGHHRYSIGIDKTGYIHVTGDMHHYMDLTVSVINPYPLRYQQQGMLYWKSNKPGDVTGGFSFAGGLNSVTTMPGSGWMMGRFFSDNNNELFYSSQVHAYESLTAHGQMAVGLYKYDTNSKTWAAIGGLAPFKDDYLNLVKPVFYWENSGFYAGVGGRSGWFQNYEAQFSFDSANRMHFVVTGNTDETINGANRLIYAMSDDGGLTWKKANGAVIAGLPIRGIDGLPQTGDIVSDNKVSPYFSALPGVVVDKNNKPGVSANFLWWVWNGTAWTNSTLQNFSSLPVSTLGYRLTNNSLLMNYSNVSKILFTPSFDSSSIGYDFTNYKGIASLDAYSLKSAGVIYNVGVKADGTEALLKTTITPAPLPTSWNFQDIDATTNGFGGNAGYANGIFTITSYGVAIEGATDSFTYAYEPLVGDGSISARVTVPQSNTRSGVMMRETLDPNSKLVSSLIYPLSTNLTARSTYRSSVGGQSVNSDKTGISLPYWVKLTRVGDVFTSFVSADGNTWTQTLTVTVPMNKNIYVGLAHAAYQSRWFMQTAKFDNVSAPSAVCTRANPTLVLSPASQAGVSGKNVTYTISLTNNDTSTCGASSFNLSSSAPNFVTANLNAYTLAVAPGSTGTATLTVASLASTPAANYTINISAMNSLSTTMTAAASAAMNVTSDCVLSAPTITYTPSSQTTFGTMSTNYSVTILSNDTSACLPRLFSLSTASSSNFLVTKMEPYNLTIAPGQTVYSTATVTPQAGLVVGTYSVSTTTQYGGSAKANLVYAASTCTHANPSLVVTPSTLSGDSGGTVNYGVVITNNDTPACGPAIFNLDANIPNTMSGKLSVNSVAVAPGSVATATLSVTSLASTPSGGYGIAVNATNASLASATGQALASYQITGSCHANLPTLTYVPGVQTITSLVPVNYSVTILNNDTATCTPRSFDFATTTSSPVLTAAMAPGSVSIAPGQTITSQVIVTPQAGITAGTYTLSTAMQGFVLAKGSLIYGASQLHK
jgi:hypothetical protein